MPSYWFYKYDMGEYLGAGITVIPGFGQWVLLHGHIRDVPAGAIPVEDVVRFLDAKL